MTSTNTAVVALLSLVLCGCADTTSMAPLQDPQGRVVTAADAIYVLVSPNGTHGPTDYPKSGQMTSRQLQSALLRHVRTVVIGGPSDNFNKGLADAIDGGFTVLIVPTILHWEDRATEWSVRSDKLEVQLEVIDVSSGKRIAKTSIKGRSGLATFGGDHPQDLLPEPINDFVDQLFSGPGPAVADE